MTDLQVREPNGRFLLTIDSAERDANAAMLRARGMSFRQIATELGYSGPSHAHQGVSRALTAVSQETAVEAREMMAAQLDVATAEVFRILTTRHVVIQQGKIVRRTNPDGTIEEIQDDGPTLEAVRVLLEIQKRRAALFGLDAPSRQVTFSFDALPAMIADLEQEIEAAGGTVPPRSSDLDLDVRPSDVHLADGGV